MIIYLAATNMPNIAVSAVGSNILTSFWELKNKKPGWLLKFRRDYKFKNVFLDCGAYSAWTQGGKVEIDDYIKFLHENIGGYDEFPNLDVKGDFNATVLNLKYIEKNNLKPMPVFHVMDTPHEYFGELIERGYKRIALGAIAGETHDPSDLYKKLKNIFNYIVDPKTREVRCKLHAFGHTIYDSLAMFPFWSADSTSWLTGGLRGAIPIFDKKEKKIRTIITNPKDGEKEFLKHIKSVPIEFLKPEALFGRGRTYQLRHYLGRLSYEAMEKDLTKLWKARGYTFTN